MTFAERFTRHWQGLHVAAGASCGCKDCGLEDLERPDDDYARYENAGEPNFSWSKCPSCGGLAGDRYPAHYWNDDGTITGHVDVCQDCLMFMANGDVPEEE